MAFITLVCEVSHRGSLAGPGFAPGRDLGTVLVPEVIADASSIPTSRKPRKMGPFPRRCKGWPTRPGHKTNG